MRRRCQCPILARSRRRSCPRSRRWRGRFKPASETSDFAPDVSAAEGLGGTERKDPSYIYQPPPDVPEVAPKDRRPPATACEGSGRFDVVGGVARGPNGVRRALAARRMGFEKEALMPIRISCRNKCRDQPQPIVRKGVSMPLAGKPKVSYADRKASPRVLCGSI